MQSRSLHALHAASLALELRDGRARQSKRAMQSRFRRKGEDRMEHETESKSKRKESAPPSSCWEIHLMRRKWNTYSIQGWETLHSQTPSDRAPKHFPAAAMHHLELRLAHRPRPLRLENLVYFYSQSLISISLSSPSLVIDLQLPSLALPPSALLRGMSNVHLTRPRRR